VIERAGENLIALCVKPYRNNLGTVSSQGADLPATFDVPQLSRVIHTASGQYCTLGIKSQADNFSVVTDGVDNVSVPV